MYCRVGVIIARFLVVAIIFSKMKSKNGSRYLPCLSGLQEVAFDSTRKRTTFLAESEGSKALVSIEAKPVSKLDLEKVQEDPTSSSLELIHSNDRWSSYSSSNMKIDITLPATEREISAASSKDFERLVCEPPQLYVSKIRPFIESSPEHQPPLWIKNILNGTSEQDRIIFKNEEFVILPDSKWCGKDRRSLYLLVLFTDGSLRTIRDLSTDRHLALLKELKSILKVFGVDYVKF